MNKKYNDDFMRANMMGPNAMTLTAELTSGLNFAEQARILDLGCGKGLSSLWLAEKFKSRVFAFDLWISATENYERFCEFGLGEQITPINGDMKNSTPFADNYFDAIISVDSYHYFGQGEHFMDEKIAPMVKKGGIIALTFPGLKKDFEGSIPPEMLVSWPEEIFDTIRSIAWWRDLFSKAQSVEVVSISEMNCCEEAWNDWLKCDDNEHAVGDRGSMEAGAGKHMNFISVICKKK